jgi:uroporphyrinogen-III decarboxylase
MDFAAHNAEVKEVWKRFHEGKPSRVPMVLGISSRFTILNPAINTKGITYEEYFNDPDVMFEHQLRHQHWIRHNLPQDAEMGLPEAWTVGVDLQNSYEQLWYGAPLRFIEGNVPDTPPFITEEGKREFVTRGVPDPFGGWMRRNWDYLEHFKERAKGYEFCGRPVKAGSPTGCGTDGPFTVACALRGPTELCLDMYTDPGFYHDLMGLIVEATIRRIRAYRERLGQPMESKAWGFADDSIQLLSVATYRELVLPYHKRLVAAFGPEGPNSIHLCGDATRHFKTIRDELKVMTFDTGFPVDHGWLRCELGPEVTIQGGPHVEVLRTGTPEAIRAETRRILQSGVMQGGKFVLREGNNLAPGTPVENVAAMYEACKEFGRHA